MIKVVSIQRMREIEATIDETFMSYDDMMESAGRSAAEHALNMVEAIAEPHITVLVGAGNNGGDGLVAARHLAQRKDIEVRLYLLKRLDDDNKHLNALQDLFITYAEDDRDNRVIRNMVASSDLVLDALFGIGVRLPLKGDAEKLLRNVNQAINMVKSAQPEHLTISPTATYPIPSAPVPRVLAIDCPSGVNCDTGESDSNTIPADETITFIAAKPGLFKFPGAALVGHLNVANIGIPSDNDALKDEPHTLVTARMVKNRLPERASNSHKGSYGKALIIAGSINYSGAAAMSALATYRAGAGLVTVGAPNPVIGALSTSLFESTWLMLPHDMGVISDNAVSVITENLEGYKALLLGPGWGQEETTGKFLETLLEKSEKVKKRVKRPIGFAVNTDEDTDAENASTEVTLPPLVIDADGLNLLAKIDSWWQKLPENTIITPHPGEMARLCDCETSEVQANRWEMAQEKAKAWNVYVVLKGAYTLIAAPDGRLAVLPFNTDALATAGTGDILAGIITSMVSQGLDSFSAAVCGGYLHGLAGELVAQSQGTSRSSIATDLLDQIGAAFRLIEAS